MPERIRRGLATLREHCDTIGRDYDTIIKSTNLNVFPTEPGADPQQVTARARGRLGMDYVNLYIPGVAYDHELLVRVDTDVIPAFS